MEPDFSEYEEYEDDEIAQMDIDYEVNEDNL
jgi:hypothetical protein